MMNIFSTSSIQKRQREKYEIFTQFFELTSKSRPLLARRFSLSSVVHDRKEKVAVERDLNAIASNF